MIWLNPAAWFALAAVAAPILIHLLIQRRAERLPFPTLRFLQPTRLASIRRHLLDDWLLLAIRVALLAAAVAALAGPLLISAARRAAWDQRVVRALVFDAQTGRGTERRTDGPAPYLERAFEGGSIADGILRAALWLDTVPPARREMVIASPFPLGSITQADIDSVPAAIGLRFDRVGALPTTRTVPGGRLLTAAGAVERQVTLEADRTSVRESPSAEPTPWPIDVVSSPADRPAVDAAIAAVRSQHVWTVAADRHARLVLKDVAVSEASPKPASEGGMAEAIARIAEDRDLRAAAARVATGLSDARYTAAPWQPLASAADGHPVAAAAASPSGLLIVSAAPASNVATPILIRSMANAIGSIPDLRSAEVTPIADAVLQRWSRPAAPVSSPRIETVDRDDRRWLWLAVVALLLLEMWVRRSRAGDTQVARAEEARVA
jgi:hypothetical protein